MAKKTAKMAPKQKVVVGLQKLHENAVLPERATKDSAGFDLYAIEDAKILPGGRTLIRTGVAMEIPPGYEGQVRPRSGLALKHGITVLNAPGTIDADYRGEVQVILYNTGPAYQVKAGEKIAQLVICRLPDVEFQVSESLSETERGSGGFGSTGK